MLESNQTKLLLESCHVCIQSLPHPQSRDFTNPSTLKNSSVHSATTLITSSDREGFWVNELPSNVGSSNGSSRRPAMAVISSQTLDPESHESRRSLNNGVLIDVHRRQCGRLLRIFWVLTFEPRFHLTYRLGCSISGLLRAGGSRSQRLPSLGFLDC